MASPHLSSVLFEKAGGKFIKPAAQIAEDLKKVKGFIFDWDGVFTSGRKDAERVSTFSELDSMGINLLRFSYWLRNGNVPFSAIVSGETNPTAEYLAKRDAFNAVFFGIKHKKEMVTRLEKEYRIHTSESAFFYDDVLDLSLAENCLISFAIDNKASVAFGVIVEDNAWCGYRSANDGGHHAIREICELMMVLNGNYEEVIGHRKENSEAYTKYLKDKRKIKTEIF